MATFNRLLATDPVRLFLVAVIVGLVLVAAVLVGLGVFELDDLTKIVGALVGLGAIVDRLNQSERGAWAPASVNQAVVDVIDAADENGTP